MTCCPQSTPASHEDSQQPCLPPLCAILLTPSGELAMHCIAQALAVIAQNPTDLAVIAQALTDLRSAVMNEPSLRDH